MAILSRQELEQYIRKQAEQIGYGLPDLLEIYCEGSTTKERIIENVTRQVETIIQTIDESLGIKSGEE